MFALVLFVGTDEVSVAPVKWLKGNECLWPEGSKNAGRLVRANEDPESWYKPFSVHVKSIYGTYEEAKKYEKRFEETSNLESEAETGKSKRKVKTKRREQHMIAENYSSDEEVFNKRPRAGSYPSVQEYAIETFNDGEGSSKSASCVNEISFTINESDIIENPPAQTYDIIPEAGSSQNANCMSAASSCSCNVSKLIEDNKYLKSQVSTIKTVLRELAQVCHEMNGALNNIADNSRGKENRIVNDSFPFELPLKSMEELKKLEDALADAKIENDLYEKMNQIGGIHLGNTVRRMLSKLLTNEVAVCFSWLGAKGKESFRDLKVSKILFYAVRNNPAISAAKDSEIESIIKDWLRHAKARKGKGQIGTSQVQENKGCQ